MLDDMCDPNPCQNNGTCVDLTDSFNCTCAPGWEDDNCTAGKADYSFCEILAISLIKSKIDITILS